MEIAQQNLRIQKWVAALSVILFVAKITGYYLTNSVAILSDALESVANVIAGFIGLYSLYVASKPRDIDHPYGHGKAEFISAAAEGTVIMGSGILIIYETVVNLIFNKPLEDLGTGLLLIVATGVVNFIAGSICIHVGRRNHSLALQASGKHLQIDTYSTLGVIAGLVIMIFTKIYWLDKVVALILSGVIIYNGYKILRQSLAGIMDEADMQTLNRMITLFNDHRSKNWMDIHNLRIIKYGRLLHVDCHLTVPWYFNVMEAHEEIDKLYNLVKNEFGDTVELMIHVDGCLPPESCSICFKDDCHVRQRSFEEKLEWTVDNILSNKRHFLKMG